MERTWLGQWERKQILVKHGGKNLVEIEENFEKTDLNKIQTQKWQCQKYNK